jgi:hypothetical protein
LSVYKTILDSAKGIVDALAITSLTTTVRKRNTITEADVFPVCIISPGAPTIESEHTENTIVWIRPVWVTIASATGDGLLETEFGLFDLEEQIRQALHKPILAGASTVFHVDMAPDPIYIPGGVDIGYDICIFRLDFWSSEDRSV